MHPVVNFAIIGVGPWCEVTAMCCAGVGDAKSEDVNKLAYALGADMEGLAHLLPSNPLLP